eukprot:1095168-Heterocapsa_arctica.AAC.1
MVRRRRKAAPALLPRLLALATGPTARALATMNCLRTLSPRIDFVAGRLTSVRLVCSTRCARQCGPL